MGIIAPQQNTARSKIITLLLLAIFLPIVLGYLFFYLSWGFLLYVAIWLTWHEKPILLIYSNSPVWKDYFETEIIPRIQGRAIILNWSERKTWKPSLPVLAFRYFGGDRNFNPMAIVFRPFRLAKTYRFFQAFKEFKHGNPEPVETIEEKLFKDIGIQAFSRNDRAG